MTPVLEEPVGTFATASDPLLLAVTIARDAAESLADEYLLSRESGRYLLAAERLDRAIESYPMSRARLLRASPAVTERSGRSKTLVEMIESDPGDDEGRLRLAKLLLRALVWRPETFPYPAD